MEKTVLVQYPNWLVDESDVDFGRRTLVSFSGEDPDSDEDLIDLLATLKDNDIPYLLTRASKREFGD